LRESDSERHLFRNGCAVGAWVAASEVYGRAVVHLNRVSAAHALEVARPYGDFVSLLAQAGNHVRSDSVLHPHVAAAEVPLRPARCPERVLDVHSKVHYVGDELRVGQRLVESAHDSESDVALTVGHKARNDGVQRTGAGTQRVASV